MHSFDLLFKRKIDCVAVLDKIIIRETGYVAYKQRDLLAALHQTTNTNNVMIVVHAEFRA